MSGLLPDPVDLDAAQKLVDAATPGPWVASKVYDALWAIDKTAAAGTLSYEDPEIRCVQEDAEFIAASRALVPALIAELRAVREAHNNTEQDLRSVRTQLDDVCAENERYGNVHNELIRQQDENERLRTQLDTAKAEALRDAAAAIEANVSAMASNQPEALYGLYIAIELLTARAGALGSETP